MISLNGLGIPIGDIGLKRQSGAYFIMATKPSQVIIFHRFSLVSRSKEHPERSTQSSWFFSMQLAEWTLSNPSLCITEQFHIVGPGASEEDEGGTKVRKRCMGEEQKEREGKVGRGWG